MTKLEDLKSKNFLHISQVRLSSIDKIPGKAFQEAKSWAKIFHHTVFLCFSENRRVHYKKINEKLVVIALPFDLETSLFRTLKNLFLNYVQLIGYIIRIIKNFKIDLIREENLIIAGIPAFIAAMATKTPYVTWLGGFERKVLGMKYQHAIIIPLLRYAIIILEYLIFRFARIVCTVSPELFELIEKRKPRGGFLSPNFVDFSIFKEKDYHIRNLQEKVTFLYSGRFELEKGITTLLKAVKNLSQTEKNFELKLAGWGKLEKQMHSFVEKNNLGNFVKFLGKFPLEELSGIYETSDVLIIPSYDEGLPVALLEAMFSGCACICTSVGMIPKYIQNDQNGILIPPYNEAALINAMRDYINNPQKIDEFGRKNHAIVVQASKYYMQIHDKIYTYVLERFSHRKKISHVYSTPKLNYEKKMGELRVLHVVSAPMDYLGGVSIFVNNLIKNLDKIGVQSDVVSCEIPAKKLNFNRMKISNPPYREFRQKTLGIIGGYNPISNIISFLLKNSQNYDLIDVHSYVFFSTIQAAIFRFFVRDPPLILHLHGGIQAQTSRGGGSFYQKLILLIKKWIYDPIFGHFIARTADAIISVSKTDLDYLKTTFKLRSLPRHSLWIPNGVETVNFYPGTKDQQEYITYIGRFIYLKGFDIFLRIASKIHIIDKTQKFLVIGSGGEMTKLVTQATQNLPLIHISNVPHKEMIKYYQKSKVLVVPSRSEGVPTTILEATACGIPVIAANVGGIPDVIDNGKTGFLFQVDNVDEAVKSVFKSLQLDFSRKIDKVGPEFIKSVFSWDSISKNTLEVYRQVVNKEKKPRF